MFYPVDIQNQYSSGPPIDTQILLERFWHKKTFDINCSPKRTCSNSRAPSRNFAACGAQVLLFRKMSVLEESSRAAKCKLKLFSLRPFAEICARFVETRSFCNIKSAYAKPKTLPKSAKEVIPLDLEFPPYCSACPICREAGETCKR